jgi:hypothetical protein
VDVALAWLMTAGRIVVFRRRGDVRTGGRSDRLTPADERDRVCLPREPVRRVMTAGTAATAAVVALVALAVPTAALQDLSCSSFHYQEDAQAVYEANLRNGSGDRFGLDPDGDGIACAELSTRDGGPPEGAGPIPTPPLIYDTLEEDLDAYWRRTFDAARLPYDSPAAVVERDNLSYAPGCGGSGGGDWAGLYCPGTSTIYWDPDDVARPERWYDDPWWVFLIAHEWGHHVQHQLDLLPPAVDPTEVPPFELQADCLAGAYVGDALAREAVHQEFVDVIADALGWSGDEYESTHGTGAEQASSFEIGLGDGPAGCGLPL